MKRTEATLISILWSGTIAIIIGIFLGNDIMIILGITLAFGSGIFITGGFFSAEDE